MAKVIGSALRELGLYKPIKKAFRYLTEPQRRARTREIRDDLRQTQQSIGAWASQPIAHADPERLFAIISFTDLPLHAKFHGLIAKTVQLQGYTPVIFTYQGCRFAHQYFDLFGIDQLIKWEEYLQENKSVIDEADEIIASLLPARPTVQEAIACTLHGVDVGKHALSMTSRKLVEGRLDFANLATLALFQNQLKKAVQGVLAANVFLDTYPAEKMLVRDAGYIPNGSLYEMALQRGVDCVVYEQGQRRGTWIFKRYTAETKGRHYFSLDPSTWEKVQATPWTPEHDAVLEAEFAGRYKTDSMDDTRRLQAGKRIKSSEEVYAQLGLDPSKKTAVIFSHIAWDAAFFFGSCLFDDFEDWLFETVKYVAAACPEMNWVVKLHPFNMFKLQREDKTEESEMRLLRTLMPLPDHVKIMRANTDINTQSLFPIVDYVLTVNGTVGMEFPCYGVPAVVAGTGRYDGLGFTIEPPSREAYFTTLKALHTTPRLTPAAKQKARQHFLTLMQRRQYSLEDIAPMDLKRIHEGQSDVHDNIHITARSLEEFGETASIQCLGDWLAHSSEPDLLALS